MAGLDRRSVGFIDVLAQSVSAVAPSAAATTIPLLVIAEAGGATVWAIAVAMFAALLVAWSVNQFARRLAATGAIYTYVTRGLGTGAGLVAGTATLIGYGFIAMFALTGAGYYAAILAERMWPAAASPVFSAACVIAMALIALAVTVRGVRFSTRLTLWIEVVSVVIILVLLVALLAVALPRVNFASVLDVGRWPAPPGLDSVRVVVVGAAIALTAFVGFESGATLGVEAKRPFAAIPRAVVWTVLASGALYLLAASSQIVGFAALGQGLSESASPVNDLASAYGVAWVGLFLDVAIATSFLACGIASITALARVLFTMGREGNVPARFGLTHPRFRTPWVAASVAVPAIAVPPVLAMMGGLTPWAVMETVLVVAAAANLAAYALVCAAVPAFLRRIGESMVVTTVVSSAAAVLLTCGLAVYLAVEFAGDGRVGASLFIALTAAGVSLALIRRRRRPWLAETAGAYDEPVASDFLGGGLDHPGGRASSGDPST